MSFTSMYIGATGIVAHNANMQVVSNNLANVSTTGYKKADMQFGTLMSQQIATGSAQYQGGQNYVSQQGMGVGVSEIRTIFKEGGLENTSETTDLAITGQGFFGVRKLTGASSTGGASHYTRAGAFRFDNQAYLVDAHGYRLQGYAVDRDTNQVATAVSDVQLPYEDIIIRGEPARVVRSQPKATTSIDMVTTLDQTAADNFTSSTDPFFAMLGAYDASQSNASSPFGSQQPAYSSSLKVYDEEGNGHDMTIYFDPVGTSTLSNATPGYTYWEYLVAMPGDSDGSSAYGTSGAGLAGCGVMVFDSSGQLVNQSAYSLNGAGAAAASAAGAVGSKNLGAWTQATFASGGTPSFNYTFGSNGGAVGTMRNIGYDFGINSDSSSWLSGAGSPAGVGLNAANLAGLADMNRDARVSTSYDSGSATLYQLQDGYTSGYLQYTSVDQDGFLSGHFTNGQTEQLYQVALYRFNSPWGLKRDGGTNFVATDASGAARDGRAEEGGRGNINQNTLETSNVDMAEEFAKMIVTQRGFQANTKVVTTSDALLNTLINTKR